MFNYTKIEATFRHFGDPGDTLDLVKRVISADVWAVPDVETRLHSQIAFGYLGNLDSLWDKIERVDDLGGAFSLYLLGVNYLTKTEHLFVVAAVTKPPRDKLVIIQAMIVHGTHGEDFGNYLKEVMRAISDWKTVDALYNKYNVVPG